MTETEISEQQYQAGQEEINKWLESLPSRAAECLVELEKKVSQMETFDLLSNISFYNHLHDADQYSDYRGDKMFVVSELIALIALKKDYTVVIRRLMNTLSLHKLLHFQPTLSAFFQNRNNFLLTALNAGRFCNSQFHKY